MKMTRIFRIPALTALVAVGLLLSTHATPAFAQSDPHPQPAARLHEPLDFSQMVAIPGSLHPLAQPAHDAGRLPGDTPMHHMMLFFSQTQQQQQALKQLIADQQKPGSPSYHRWLTPQQFAAQFGVNDADIAKTEQWLQQQGFSIDSVANGKDFIVFSGNATQVEQAFQTEMHRYRTTWRGQTEMHFAPSTLLHVPAALSPIVLGVRDLDNFKPHSMLLPLAPQARAALSAVPRLGSVQPAFTSGLSGNHFLAPGDIGVIYDVRPLGQQGIDGAGQTIVVAGQSAIQVSDIEAFQKAAGLTVKDPSINQVPGTGTSTVVSGDEGESDIDIEWAGAMAPGATIDFIYTGSTSQGGVFDAITYAVDNKIGQIISVSYGACEFDIGTYNNTFEMVDSKAVAQGQTILAAAGDSGSTSCYGSSSDTTTQQQQLNVNYPASSPNVTAVGGTEFSEGNATGATQYWDSSAPSDVLTSAKSYIPETTWNDDASQYIAAGGGGVSGDFTKPTWQVGVPGIPPDGQRDVPDVSLDASNNHDAYLLCTSDQSNWDTTSSPPQSSSCTSGFRDSTSQDLTAAGGTSFATPIMAGMLALINQKVNATGGQGLINPTLYHLAANSSTYSSAFHDITTGGNDCQAAGSSACSGNALTEYAAGAGYDLATGLGSFDLNALASAWPMSTGTSLVSTTTAIAASTTTPNIGQNVTFTIGVSATSGGGTPTGTVTISVDGVTQSPTLNLTNGTASYTTSFSTPGAHTVEATYSGDATYASSNGTTSVTAGVVSTGVGGFTMTATNMTVTDGNKTSSTVSITPNGGYAGTVMLSVTPTGSNANNLASACFQVGAITVGPTGTSTGTFSVDTSAQNCINTNGQYRHFPGAKRNGPRPAGNPRAPIGAAAMLGGLLLAGFLGRKSQRLRMLAMLVLLVGFGLGMTACNSNGYAPSYGGYGYGYGYGYAVNPPKGNYMLTVTGTDSKTSSITNQTTLTLTIN